MRTTVISGLRGSMKISKDRGARIGYGPGDCKGRVRSRWYNKLIAGFQPVKLRDTSDI